ncbi:hypothetical protein H6F95_19785 [Cyanobacteria bacterium FACHB-471]|nr:hypothetical protein [Cyanobacteria bacterium FACHB-471]
MQILASTLLTAIAPRQSATTQTVYQLKITLKDAKPWVSRYFDPIVRHPSHRFAAPIIGNSFEHPPPV